MDLGSLTSHGVTYQCIIIIMHMPDLQMAIIKHFKKIVVILQETWKNNESKEAGSPDPCH